MDDLPATGGPATRDLRAPRMLAALAGTRFRRVEVHAELDSTQAVLSSEGGPDGRTVVADHQTAGRGRAGRSWTSAPGSGAMFSVLLAGSAPERAPLVSLAAGLAVAGALGSLAGLDAKLKWPNDVLVDGAKICGILGEVPAGASHVVLGIGINVHHTRKDLPPDVAATSVRIAGVSDVARDDVIVAVLRELDALLGAMPPEGPPPWLEDYRERCATIGSRVRVETGQGSFEGNATGVRDDGALVVDERTVVAGDVIHVRGADA